MYGHEISLNVVFDVSEYTRRPTWLPMVRITTYGGLPKYTQ